MAQKNRQTPPPPDPLETILDKQFVMTDAGRVDRIRDLYTPLTPMWIWKH